MKLIVKIDNPLGLPLKRADVCTIEDGVIMHNGHRILSYGEYLMKNSANWKEAFEPVEDHALYGLIKILV